MWYVSHAPPCESVSIVLIPQARVTHSWRTWHLCKAAQICNSESNSLWSAVNHPIICRTLAVSVRGDKAVCLTSPWHTDLHLGNKGLFSLSFSLSLSLSLSLCHVIRCSPPCHLSCSSFFDISHLLFTFSLALLQRISFRPRRPNVFLINPEKAILSPVTTHPPLRQKPKTGSRCERGSDPD